MSFEGYYRILCKNGHLHHHDPYSYGPFHAEWKCSDCGAPAAFEQLVDETNDCNLTLAVTDMRFNCLLNIVGIKDKQISSSI